MPDFGLTRQANAGRSGGAPTLISYMDMAIGAITL
jgi:hypothetical protein